ncbi:hypothetical protein BIV57_16080 [Mangrovactinospora gilvigrisea]|uniref:Secreted protein n=1 Tax=Mangrovactinospora gilvigrisea TaxID=1428644 RepID=A0A1J7BSQ3_9ACTN|nr:hypothetical protein BIV57_16080 [Mangrovactinospora gilvigrisea]
MRSPFRGEPGRLRAGGLLIVVLAVLFGALTAWQITSRADAAQRVTDHSAPLASQAASVYWSLADADATAAAGFLIAGQEPAKVTARYQQDIANASKGLAAASAAAGSNSDALTYITTLNRELPVYTGLVETARANNRQGYPVGGAYLRYASDRMSSTMLPAAEKLYQTETRRLSDDRAAASATPWAAYAAGLIALGGVVWASRRLFLRTNRVFNTGLLASGAALLVALAWLAGASTLSTAKMHNSATHGSDAVQTLNQARIAGLQARGNEDLTLVARGNGDTYITKFDKWAAQLTGSAGKPGLLDRARGQSDAGAADSSIDGAKTELKNWMALHKQARGFDDGGNYQQALDTTVGRNGNAVKDKTTEGSFDAMDKQLGAALQHEQALFYDAARGGSDALAGLAIGGAVLCLLGAAAAVGGLGRRLAEYR